MTESLALIIAFVFGLSYNYLIGRWIASGYADGMTGIWVAVGVFITLCISALPETTTARLQLYWLGNPIILTNQQHAAIYELKFFIAAGIPMLAGSIWRYLQTATIVSIDDDKG